MPGTLQNKLQQFEVVPPPAVWDKISRQLDEEFAVPDSHLSSKLEDASITPPPDLWHRINAELGGDPALDENTAKVVPLYKKIAVAAIVVGALFIAGLYFLTGNPQKDNIVETVPAKVIPPAAATIQQPKLPDTNNSTVVVPNETNLPLAKKEANRPLPKPRVIENTPSFADGTENPEEAPLYDLQTVSALQPVSVSAPPLRDKKGNIILDASLISHPDDEYIVVTGPNGKQTKISSKFLNCLGYINATLTSNDVDTRAIQCKTQFEEWRKKILAQPAFIPTANNFFDIFELKDLLQEM